MTSRLFIKPWPGMTAQEILFLLPQGDQRIAFRSLDLSTDLHLIHDWVNQPYTQAYWQLGGDESRLRDHYKAFLDDLQSHSFIGLFNNTIVCQIDCYQVAADELKDYVPSEPGNCGLHILMCPPRELQKGLTESMLRAFVKFFFSFGAAETLYGEPDCRNTAANTAAKRSGFELLRTIQLSYKTANLYYITKQQFHATHPIA